MAREVSSGLTENEELRLEWLASRTPRRQRRAAFWALAALLAILAPATAVLAIETSRMARAAGLSPLIAWQRLGPGVMRTGDARLIRAVADLQIAAVMTMAVASWLIGVVYIERRERLAVRVWTAARGAR